MRRRHLLSVLAGGAVGLAGPPSSAQNALISARSVSELMRLNGLEPQPGESDGVRAFLLSTRPRRSTDPRVEPAIRFEPAIDPRDPPERA